MLGENEVGGLVRSSEKLLDYSVEFLTRRDESIKVIRVRLRITLI